MPQLKVIKEEPITLSELKKHLESIKKVEEDLNFRSNKTYEYVHQLNLISATKSKELKKKLEALEIPRLKEEYIVKIIDTLPFKKSDQIKQLFQGYPISLNNADIQKIFDVASEYS